MNETKQLKKQVIDGVFWKFGERIIAQGVAFIISTVLARILLPEDYGTVSLILVFITLANVFVSNGLGDSLIQKRDADELDFSTMFYCSIAFSIVLYLIIFFAAPVIADFYDNQSLTPYVRVLALQIPLAAVKTIQHSYVSKHMLFKKFFFSTLGGTLVSGVVGIIMALNGFGAWALIAQYLINSAIDTTVLYFTVRWRPTLEFSISRAKTLFGFGWKVMVSQFINTFYGDLRSLIIGKVYSSSDLAYYNKGNQFPSLAITNLNTSISTVLFPAMSSVNSEMSEIKKLTRRSMQVSSYVVFPIMAGLAVVASPLVSLLLTDKWLPCVPYLQLSCMYWAFQPMQTANVQAIKAAGRADITLYLEIIKKSIGIILILVTMRISVMAVVVSNVIFGGISMLINIFPNKKLISYGYKEQFIDVAPNAILAIIMLLITNTVQYLNLNNWLTLIIQIFVGVVVYLLGSVLTKNESFHYLYNTVLPYLKSFMNKRGKH